MRSLSENDLVCQLQVELQKEFDDEEFLVEELIGIVQALINSVRWTALLTSQLNDWEAVLTLRTDDHFCNEVMNRQEIVSRIENTSGLNPEMSEYALQVIEKRVDDETGNEVEPSVEIEHIGVIERRESPRYRIHLSEELRIAPQRMDDTFEVPTSSSLER